MKYDFTSIMHRSGRKVLLIACTALSVTPMLLRLLWQRQRN